MKKKRIHLYWKYSITSVIETPDNTHNINASPKVILLIDPLLLVAGYTPNLIITKKMLEELRLSPTLIPPRDHLPISPYCTTHNCS